MHTSPCLSTPLTSEHVRTHVSLLTIKRLHFEYGFAMTHAVLHVSLYLLENPNGANHKTL